MRGFDEGATRQYNEEGIASGDELVTRNLWRPRPLVPTFHPHPSPTQSSHSSPHSCPSHPSPLTRLTHTHVYSHHHPVRHSSLPTPPCRRRQTRRRRLECPTRLRRGLGERTLGPGCSRREAGQICGDDICTGGRRRWWRGRRGVDDIGRDGAWSAGKGTAMATGGTRSKANLKPNERVGRTRGRDGWSSIGGEVRCVPVIVSRPSHEPALPRRDAHVVFSFSLSPGWSFVKTEGWRPDLIVVRAVESAAPSASVCVGADEGTRS